MIKPKKITLYTFYYLYFILQLLHFIMCEVKKTHFLTTYTADASPCVEPNL